MVEWQKKKQKIKTRQRKTRKHWKTYHIPLIALMRRMAAFNGLGCRNERSFSDAAVENDKENAISHQMKIPHISKLSGLC